MRSIAEATIFSSKIEKLNLTIPFIFLIAVLFEFTFSSQLSSESLWHKIVIDIVFLNVTHNAFTIAIILGVPEIKAWLTERSMFEKKRLIGESALVLLAIYFFHYYALLNPSVAWVKIVFTFLIFFIPAYHALAQSFGLNYIYNSHAKTEQINQLEKHERVLSGLFVGLILIYLTMAFFSKIARSILGQEAVSWLIPLTLGLAALNLCMFAHLFSKYPKNIRRKKFLFSSRYMLWFLACFSPIAAISTRCIHGVEYACVTYKIMSRSNGKYRWILLFTFSIIVSYMCYFREIIFLSLQNHETLHWSIISIGSLSIAVSYLHYYLDRKLFRMRNHLNRKTVGALLID